MALEITGKIVQILDLQTGTSAKGEWKKQDFILETEDQYPRKICIALWGDRIGDIAGVQVGNEVITASVALESREFNGKWYTDVRAWRIQRGGGIQVQVTQNATQSAPQSSASIPPSAPPADDNYANTGGESFDDLPF